MTMIKARQNAQASGSPPSCDMRSQCSPLGIGAWPFGLGIVVVALAALVHCGVPADAAAPGRARGQAERPGAAREVKPGAVLQPSAIWTNAKLPVAAAEMRETILIAVRSGKIADLRTALELNEMRPDIADEPVEDPIAHLKTLSKDGEGREILAVLGQVLDMPPAVVPLGRDIENNAIYVWPYLAERDLAALEPKETADLAKLVPADEAAAMVAGKRWTWWRLAIGADGTWHSFRREK
jgi:hypothetical protein